MSSGYRRDGHAEVALGLVHPVTASFHDPAPPPEAPRASSSASKGLCSDIRWVLPDYYALLSPISCFTVGDDEGGTLLIPVGTPPQDAAGPAHSDIWRHFIRTEVTGYDELIVANGSFADVRTRGKLGLEGKEYTARDGDICHFPFNARQ